MSNRRMITSDLFEDDIIGSLPQLDRLVWIGLITLVDDQGRVADIPGIIRSRIFPYDEITVKEINEALTHLAESSRITRYQADGKKCIQINNWWKHQRTQWAGKSNLPAPEGWTDRARYNSSDGITMINWKLEGGYNSTPLTEVDGEVDGWVDGEIDTTPALTEVKLSKVKINKLSKDADTDTFDDIMTSIQTLTGTLQTQLDYPAIKEMVELGVIESDIRGAVAYLTAKGYKIRGARSLINAVKVEREKRIQKSTASQFQADEEVDMKGYTDATIYN